MGRGRKKRIVKQLRGMRTIRKKATLTEDDRGGYKAFQDGRESFRTQAAIGKVCFLLSRDKNLVNEVPETCRGMSLRRQIEFDHAGGSARERKKAAGHKGVGTSAS